RVVVSGGQGRNETITEAEGMRRALVKQGVAAERIYLEDRASSTLENLRYSRDVILATGGNTDRGFAVVTSNFHLLRVRLLAKRVGMRVWCVPAPTPWYLLPNVCLREYFALIKSLLADW
ncbi:MAG TPA: YdcF family protein, partial [Candidatus Hydrogenedentes bacterium]|nr:YdcF family protein [Candidatus Hydrogenedentota bacterium]